MRLRGGPELARTRGGDEVINLHSSVASRTPGITIAAGGAVLLIAGFTTVGQDVYTAESASDVATALSDARTTWNVSNAIGGIGVLVAATGLALLGRDVRRVSRQLRVCRAASIARWFGLATAVQAVILFWNAVAPTSSLADAYGDPTSAPLLIFVGIAWTIAMLGTFVALGLALRWLPHQRWLGWLLLTVGVLAATVFSAFMGPDAAYFVLIIAGVTLAISPKSASTVTASEPT